MKEKPKEKQKDTPDETNRESKKRKKGKSKKKQEDTVTEQPEQTPVQHDILGETFEPKTQLTDDEMFEQLLSFGENGDK